MPAGPHVRGCSTPETGVREITDRRWLLRPVDDTVQEINTFLRGWAGYFRYGNSAHHFGAISNYAARCVASHVAKRHKRTRGYGWSVLAFQSTNRLGLIDLDGIVVAPRPHRAWRG